ncbi:PQQ-dependent sugar dehydrogenase [Aeromicrobium sp. CTD01-1L150]|uniref:PQQ-dependent sugar dehydrogenase n=1 Tax=Aeromicrobium sp. CTD01-1L150 TaxID=3341830 RepID=UPI0035C09C36
MRRFRTPVRLIAGLSALAVGLALAPGAATAERGDDPDAPITDPIPEDPRPADLALELQEVVQLPESEPTPEPTDPRIMRHNRINFVSEVPDGSGRLAVPDLNGPMYLLDGEGRETEYLDVRDHDEHFFSGRGMGSGFGFVTFHPEFSENGRFYTTHTVDEDGIAEHEPTYPNQPNATVQSVVTEWTADDPSATTFSGTSREVFRFGFATQIHAIQQIDFNPTAEPGDEDYGLLYLAVGDGGIGLDTDIPQDKGNPAGKILRIDPLGEGGPNDQYGIPDSNPFVDTEGALGEIYALGLRDPHRFTWDPASPHGMFLGHIGQRAVEAVYAVEKGDNFGWSDIEGRLRYDNATQCWLYPLTDELEQKGYTYPVASYDHDVPANWGCNQDSGHAVSGGQVYRGPIRELRGRYVFGDLVNGSVYSTEVKQMRRGAKKEAAITELALQDTDGNRMRMTDFTDDVRVDLRFGSDAKGDLYLLAKSNGTIWKVTDAERIKPRQEVDPKIADRLVSYYDFERGFAQDGAKEEDGGSANLLLDLVNGGTDMRVRDAAYPGSVNALQTRQVSPDAKGNDDWKAGIWDEDGVQALERFSGAEGITVMGWFKMTGDHPAPNTETDDPDDVYNAVGLAGLLSGDSDGHGVRALLELIDVDGELRLVALGRRLDEGASRTFAASQDWQDLLPKGEWVHLAATFDYTSGEMALYRNGKPLPGFYTDGGRVTPGSSTAPTGVSGRRRRCPRASRSAVRSRRTPPSATRATAAWTR